MKGMGGGGGGGIPQMASRENNLSNGCTHPTGGLELFCYITQEKKGQCPEFVVDT